MDNMIRIDKDYIEWLKHVKKDLKRCFQVQKDFQPLI